MGYTQCTHDIINRQNPAAARRSPLDPSMSDLVLLSLIGLLGFACQWLAWRVRLPAILFLLVTGILLGPVFELLNPDELFGDLLISFISLSVAIILFEGSLTLKRTELSEIGTIVRRLVTYGALVNAVITTIATHYLTGLGWSLSALFGAIMVVTGPTVIAPMLRTVRPNDTLARTLRWEGIVIDPLGALFAVLVFEWIIVQHTSPDLSPVLLAFARSVFTGLGLGVLSGYLLGLLLRRRQIPAYLQNFAVIAALTSIYALSDTVMHESGLLAVTVMGIWLANMPGVHTRDILNFKESLTLILVSSLFILLSSRIDFDSLVSVGWGALGVLLVMQFLARPAKVFLCTLGSSMSFNERLLLAWVGPRGIVAAAISAVFALKLEALGYTDAAVLVPLAFTVIIGTVVIQGATARILVRKLGVAEPDNTGYLIVGANPVARAVAGALNDVGVRTVLCDNNWRNISAARMANLETYYGNPISSHAEVHLDLTGIGGMLGLSSIQAENTSAALRFREDFSMRKIFVLGVEEGDASDDKTSASEERTGRRLFARDVDYWRLYRTLVAGGQIKNTQVSETYPFTQWQADNAGKSAIPLFALDADNELLIVSAERELEPEAGWTLYWLSEASDDDNSPPAE